MRANMPRTSDRRVNEKPFRIALNLRESAQFYPLDLQKIVYFPWLQALDPITNNVVDVPPSGHVAGIYARVDNDRGVHKAPANQPAIGALGLKYSISKAQQD